MFSLNFKQFIKNYIKIYKIKKKKFNLQAKNSN